MSPFTYHIVMLKPRHTPCQLDKSKKCHNTWSCHFFTKVSQHQSQHQQQSSNNNKNHTGCSRKNNERHKWHKVNASSYYNALWTTDAGISIACMMWSQLSQCSQLLQSTTIVATPTTIVAILINHNCRNFLKKYCVFIIDFVQNYDISISYIFQQSLLHFSPLNYEKLCNTVAHHKTILQLLQFWYWNCDNCEIFKIIAVSYE